MVPGEFKYTCGTIPPIDPIDEDPLKHRSRNLFPACSLARNDRKVRAAFVRSPALTFALSSLRSHQLWSVNYLTQRWPALLASD